MHEVTIAQVLTLVFGMVRDEGSVRTTAYINGEEVMFTYHADFQAADAWIQVQFGVAYEFGVEAWLQGWECAQEMYYDFALAQYHDRLAGEWGEGEGE